MFATCLLTLMLTSSTADSAALRQAIDLYNCHAVETLPALSDPDLRALLKGEVVRLYVSPHNGEAAKTLGLLLSPLNRDRLWLATRDDHYVATDNLDMRLLARDARGSDWYGYLHLPWPFGGRHWTVRIENNLELSLASGNRAWERSWRLSDRGELRGRRAVLAGKVPGVDADDLDDAIYTPVNHGAWLAVQVPGYGTLLGFQLASVIGGVIPDELVARYSLFRMESILRSAEERARQVHLHYRMSHAAVPGGDGRPMAFYGELAKARGARASQAAP